MANNARGGLTPMEIYQQFSVHEACFLILRTAAIAKSMSNLSRAKCTPIKFSVGSEVTSLCLGYEKPNY